MLAPFPSEGGHGDFAPRTNAEAELSHYLRERHGFATWEYVVSGPGFVNLYQFLASEGALSADARVAAIVERTPSEAPAAISQAGLDKSCDVCVEVLRWFVRLYGSVAGNFALATLARGGVYLGGGIAPRLIPQLKGPEFRHAFTHKDEMQSQLEAIRVCVVNNPDTALHGAAVHAARSELGAPDEVVVNASAAHG
jgi:glucokinase